MNWTTLVKTLHDEERLESARQWAERRRQNQAANRSRMKTAVACLERAIELNERMDAYRHLVRTAIANLVEAEKEALYR